jgi:copper oxidase (laccase) domain-containing protein
MALHLSETKGFPLLEVEAWQRSLRHGFLGSSFDFRSSALEGASQRFCRSFGAEKLYLLKQVHSNNWLTVAGRQDLESAVSAGERAALLGEADAVIIPASARASLQGAAFAVRTGDCLPVLVKNGDCLALIHAGWRGLASGVLEAVLTALGKLSGSLAFELAIGPAAGESRYEVGPEVIEALGPEAVYHPSRATNKFLLSLQETARRKVGRVEGGRVRLWISEICTISDAQYHSYRRDGEKCGSNLAFFLL